MYDLGADDSIIVRPAAQLVAAADGLCAEVRATHLRNARQLPAVITELTTAALSASSTELWRALASTYRTAHDVAVKLGYYDLSSVALDRMDWAAQRASDPCLAAVRQYMRALVYFREGEYRIGQRLIATGHGCVAQAGGTREALAVAGQLHLGATVIAARARDEAAVANHIGQAGQIADEIGDASDIHWLSFGPANVAMHRMSAAVEMRHYDEALRRRLRGLRGHADRWRCRRPWRAGRQRGCCLVPPRPPPPPRRRNRMSAADGTAWQWRDSSSGSGAMQRVLVISEGQYQQAYRDYMDHLLDCLDCDAQDGGCADGETLRAGMRAARGLVSLP